MILGTEGHMAEGTNENAAPSRTISTTAIQLLVSIGIEKSTCTITSSAEPISMIVAPRPLRS